MSDEHSAGTQQGYLSERVLFLLVSVLLLLLTTNRFHGDMWAFFWSLIVIGGVMYLGE